jgi:hypothetical protein
MFWNPLAMGIFSNLFLLSSEGLEKSVAPPLR